MLQNIQFLRGHLHFPKSSQSVFFFENHKGRNNLKGRPLWRSTTNVKKMAKRKVFLVPLAPAFYVGFFDTPPPAREGEEGVHSHPPPWGRRYGL